ncbi:SDR family oxidoreductase [Candidatus Babeliales bacterium]|nr:SDR family oxidoreductase [Candidatus Babeliales bacterium]
MSKKIILITGGAGFLGCNLTRKLLEEGHKVIVLDDLSTGRLQNLIDFEKNENFEFIKHDICDPIDVRADWIFNFACPASPPKYQKDPIQTIKTSVWGSFNLLELARKYGSRILHTSTSEVYGDPTVHPQIETYRGNVNPIGIRACYDEGKRCAETLFFDYKRKFDLDIKVVRIFNTYGPYMDPDDGRVISNFVVRALKGLPLEVYGDGKQTRSFCYVDDMIKALLLMINSNSDVIGPINIGNPGEFSINELVKVLESLFAKKLSINYKNLPQDDPMKRKPDITLARELLGWEPKINLNEGLENSVKYFRSVISEYNADPFSCDSCLQ